MNNQSKPIALNTTIGLNRKDRGINALDSLKMGTQEQIELEKIMLKVSTVKAAGFGEIRILVRNGNIYRILVTEEELLKHDRTG